MFEKIIFGIISIFMAGIAVTLLEGLGTLIFPIPSDIDTTDMESLRANVHRIPIGAKITPSSSPIWPVQQRPLALAPD